MFRRLFHIILVWYAVWFLVGLVVVAIPYESPVGHWEDLLFMLLAAAVIFMDAVRRIGWGAAGAIFLWIAILSGVVEMLGAMTTYPFGHYSYTGLFGPTIGGVLPWAIPLAWWVVLYPLLLFFSVLSRERMLSSGFVAFSVAFMATAIDLALEPVATIVRGYWIWWGGNGDYYYDVPLQNFLGWFVTAFLIIWPVQHYLGRFLTEGYLSPGAMFLPLAALLSVLASFLVAGLVHGLWLASAWTAFLSLMFALVIFRYAWPRRDVFMLKHEGRYRSGFRPRRVR
ncbi:carotenoid biosynthesis protein [Cerasicoccus arenae]|uniref:Carotenoid biosynthesis protein n=1 Tax=Cerasicoccus arenae TaxID=424488 RepID=A0A8J3DJA1_9BACT|nr:carotenoid biosynthesis protein [Cerasicoccus arenae]MBK1856781.1 carotenoid biosynthesis protein [Cerasicoccus arenae]GHB99461.1 hypothetical protein GCM10007047_14640 [Cerasicoccus arenae]